MGGAGAGLPAGRVTYVIQDGDRMTQVDKAGVGKDKQKQGRGRGSVAFRERRRQGAG